jgi:hypothetical protein
MDNLWLIDIPGLVNIHSLRTGKWPIEIVDLPFLTMVIFHSYVNVYQIARKCLVFPVDLFILGVQSWEVKP